MPTDDIRSTVDWLVDGARSTMQAHQVLAELCERLVGCGIPLWRVAVFVRTLHPHIMGRRFIWRPGADVEVRDAPFDLLETAEFRGSPVAKVYATGMPIRRRLAGRGQIIRYPFVPQLSKHRKIDGANSVWCCTAILAAATDRISPALALQ
jgi:adenylate cyclase